MTPVVLEAQVRHPLEPAQGLGAPGGQAGGRAEARAEAVAERAPAGALPALGGLGRRRDRRGEAAARVMRAGELAEQCVEARPLLGGERGEELVLDSLAIARSRWSCFLPAGVMLTTCRRRSCGSRCRTIRSRSSSPSSTATRRLGSTSSASAIVPWVSLALSASIARTL